MHYDWTIALSAVTMANGATVEIFPLTDVYSLRMAQNRTSNQSRAEHGGSYTS